MTHRWREAGLAVAAALLATRPGAGQQGEGKVVDPFIYQFLIPGDAFDEKILAQEKRVEENPNSAALRNDFGNLLAERRFAEQARDQYKKALKLDEHFFLAAYNLGMLEEALISAICLTQGFVPGTLNCQRVDSALSSHILRENQSWSVRRVLSNIFGFGGNNCSLVLGVL